jgi:hypothetical protein
MRRENSIFSYLLLFLKKALGKKNEAKKHSKNKEFQDEIIGFKKLNRDEIVKLCLYFTECRSPMGAHIEKEHALTELIFSKKDKDDLKRLTKHYVPY